MNRRVAVLTSALALTIPLAIHNWSEWAKSQPIVYHFPACHMHAEDFSAKRSSMPAADTIEAYFNTLDDVTEATDGALAAFFKKQNVEQAYGEYKMNFDKALAKIKLYQFPSEIKPAAELIQSAIEEQRKFFDEWYLALANNKPFANPLRHQLAFSSSGKLHQAYGHLYLTFKTENECNLEAFSSHLCSLDLL